MSDDKLNQTKKSGEVPDGKGQQRDSLVGSRQAPSSITDIEKPATSRPPRDRKV